MFSTCHLQAQHVWDIFLISDFTCHPDTGNQDKQSHESGYQLSNSIYDLTGYSVLITEIKVLYILYCTFYIATKYLHIYIPRCVSVWLVITGPASIGTLILLEVISLNLGFSHF